MTDAIRSEATRIAKRALAEAKAGSTTASPDLAADIAALIHAVGRNCRPLVRPV